MSEIIYMVPITDEVSVNSFLIIGLLSKAYPDVNKGRELIEKLTKESVNECAENQVPLQFFPKAVKIKTYQKVWNILYEKYSKGSDKMNAIKTKIKNTDWYTINKNGELVLGASDGDTALFKARDVFEALNDKGEWVKMYSEHFFKCSVCSKVSKPTKFCSHCGKPMKERI